jgi:hypothetical protein
LQPSKLARLALPSGVSSIKKFAQPSRFTESY